MDMGGGNNIDFGEPWDSRAFSIWPIYWAFPFLGLSLKSQEPVCNFANLKISQRTAFSTILQQPRVASAQSRHIYQPRSSPDEMPCSISSSMQGNQGSVRTGIHSLELPVIKNHRPPNKPSSALESFMSGNTPPPLEFRKPITVSQKITITRDTLADLEAKINRWPKRVKGKVLGPCHTFLIIWALYIHTYEAASPSALFGFLEVSALHG